MEYDGERVTGWRVHEFGVASVADVSGLERAVRIVEDDPLPRVAVVLPAFRGVGEALAELVRDAERQDGAVGANLRAVERRHAEAIGALLGADAADELAQLHKDCHDIGGLLQTVMLVRTAAAAMRDTVTGFGPLWTSRAAARRLRQGGRRTGVAWLDARDVVVAARGAGGAAIDWGASRARAALRVPAEGPATLVLPRGLARDHAGVPVCFDEDAALSDCGFGRLFGTADVTVWTDVNGGLTAIRPWSPLPP